MNINEIKEEIKLLSSSELRDLVCHIHKLKEREEIELFVKEVPSVKDAFFMYKFDAQFDQEYVLSVAYMKNGALETDNYKWSEDEKEYIYMVTSSFGLSESSENSYFMYEPDIDMIVAGLKELGLKQVDPWW